MRHLPAIITAPGRGRRLLTIALFLAWVLVVARVAGSLPTQAASWLTFIALVITPGYFLADLITWRLKLDWLEQLALAMPLGVAILAVPGTIALVQHLTLDQLTSGWIIASALVFLTWLVHGIWLRSFFRQFDSSRYPDPEDRNVSPWELAAYAHDQPNLDARYRTNGTLDQLRAFIANGIPVIIELGLDPPGEYAWMEWYGHYLLVVAYDDARGQVWVYDSWLGTSAVPGENGDRQGRTIPYDVLQTYWRQFNNNYIALYRPEQAETVARIMGADMDDAVMWQRALTTVQSLLGADPQNPYLWFDLGTVYNALGEYERAATAFDQARNIGLPWRMLWYQFGPYEAYYQVGRYADVILLADVTLQDRPYFEEAFYYKALAQQALGQAEEARRNLQRAVAFNPNYQPAQVALAQMTDGN